MQESDLVVKQHPVTLVTPIIIEDRLLVKGAWGTGGDSAWLGWDRVWSALLSRW